MTISELICILQAIKCEHGDLLVAVPKFSKLTDASKVECVSVIHASGGIHKSVFISEKIEL